DEDSQARHGLRRAVEGIRRHLIACVLPEGERSIDGRVKAFQNGLDLLLAQTRVAVVPAAILGTYQVLPREAERLRFHPVSVRFGHPIPAGNTTKERLRDTVEQLLNTP